MANGGEPAAPPPPDAFRQGMFVLHEVYGLGQIIALSGSGTESQGDRRFRSAGGPKEIPPGRKQPATGRDITRWKTFVAADDEQQQPNQIAPAFSMIARALAHRNYRLFFFGQGVSLIGTWMQQTALSWLA